MDKILEQKIIEYYSKGYDVKTIFEKYSIKQYNVYYILRKHGATTAKKLTLKGEEIQKIKKEHSQGMSLEILSKKYNIEKTKLCKLVNSEEVSKIRRDLIILLYEIIALSFPTL